MKTVKIFLLLLVLVPFNNIFSQHFIGQDKIDEVKQEDIKEYWVKTEKVKDKYIYLELLHIYNYVSDIKVGFNKLEYNSSDEMVITVKRGYKNKADSEAVAITGCGDYLRFLKKGEQTQINIKCKGSVKFVRLGFHLGPQFGPRSGESRTYIILFLDRLNEGILEKVNKTEGVLQTQEYKEFDRIKLNQESEKVKSLGGSNIENENTSVSLSNGIKKFELYENELSNTVYNPLQTVTISGTIQYKNPHTSTDEPVNNWLLLLYESNTSSDLDVIDENDPHTDYPVSSTIGNGSYNVNINITQSYFKLGIVLIRYSGSHLVYFTGRHETINGDTYSVPYQILTSKAQNNQTQWNFDHTYNGSASDGIDETLRRCAYIANRLNFSIATNVGGDNLATIQSVIVATRNDVISSGSFSAFQDPDNSISWIQIGSDVNSDLYDAVIIHEYGHKAQCFSRNV